MRIQPVDHHQHAHPKKHWPCLKAGNYIAGNPESEKHRHALEDREQHKTGIFRLALSMSSKSLALLPSSSASQVFYARVKRRSVFFVEFFKELELIKSSWPLLK